MLRCLTQPTAHYILRTVFSARSITAVFMARLKTPAYMRYANAFYNTQQSYLSNNRFSVNPNHTNTTTVYMSGCDGLTFNGNTYIDQQSAASVVFLNGGTAVRILGSIVLNSTAPSFFGASGVVTNSFAETPINEQGTWTPVLNSFPCRTHYCATKICSVRPASLCYNGVYVCDTTNICCWHIIYNRASS